MSGLRYAYNTNGLAHHRLDDALHWLADLGYAGVALTPDVQHLDPYRATPAEVDRTAALLDRLGLECVIQTGARFVLDPRRKHHPNLLDPDPDSRARRVDLLRRCLDLGHDLGATVLSFWSGVPDAALAPERAWEHLRSGAARVADLAEERSMLVAVEPEPGMLLETVADYDRLAAELDHPSVRLSLDVGHVHCNREGAPADFVRSHAEVLADVQIEDMREDVHEHLYFGEGTLDVAATLAALLDVEFAGLVGVELSRDSHRAHQVVPGALAYLRAAEVAALDLSE